MWLLPVIGELASALTLVFYRLDRVGGRPPATGPLLLFANHNNSLLDPALVMAAARRPVRFLAKAPLFSDPAVGWLVRAAGAIPVHRRMDNPSAMSNNRDTFEAAERALAGGDAIGIFPEGISHDEPSLSPLKTGAARMALGAARRIGATFPLLPVGLVFRQKTIFRSEAHVIVGAAVAWDDLAGRPADDSNAVRELTARIDRALRTVTINLEQWEDAPLVACAEAVWTAERGEPDDAASRVARTAEVTNALARLREAKDPRWMPLAQDLARHERLLRRLQLSPSDLRGDPRLGEAARWSIRQLPYVGFPAWIISAIGTLLWFVPYRLTGILADRTSPRPDTVSTHKAMYGTVFFLGWWILLIIAAAAIAGGRAALGTMLLAPAAGLITLTLHDRWRDAWGQARRYFLRRRRVELVAGLRARQTELAARLDALWKAQGVGVAAGAGPRTSGSGSSATT